MDKEIEKKYEAVLEHRFSNPEKSYEICCEILEYGIREEDHYAMAYARMYMGDTLFTMGKLRAAIDNMMLAEKIEKKYGYKELLMKNYNITAIIYVNQGDGLLGLDYYCKALEMAKKRNDEVMLCMVYNNIGALLHNTGEIAGATKYFEQCYELCQKREEKEKKKIYNKKQYCVNVGVGYISEGKLELAKKFLDLASEEEGAEPDESFPISEINRLVDYVNLYCKMRKYDKAYEKARKILILPESVLKEVEAFRHITQLSSLLIEMGYYEDAKRILTILDKEYGESPVLKHRVTLCENWICFYKATGEKKKLQDCYRCYYELKQKMKKEENGRVVRAIDNRYKLEYERVTNEQILANTRELMKTSEVDELTGISNRYGLRRRFYKLCEAAQFQKYKICMCIFDIDGFKAFNDEYGHLNGDACLKEIVRILLETVGNEYFASRYGGDEFVILGINKNDQELETFIEKLYGNIREAKLPFLPKENQRKVTVSMGAVNKLPDRDCSLDAFIRAADKNLYQAKKDGKNRYVIG